MPAGSPAAACPLRPTAAAINAFFGPIALSPEAGGPVLQAWPSAPSTWRSPPSRRDSFKAYQAPRGEKRWGLQQNRCLHPGAEWQGVGFDRQSPHPKKKNPNGQGCSSGTEPGLQAPCRLRPPAVSNWKMCAALTLRCGSPPGRCRWSTKRQLAVFHLLVRSAGLASSRRHRVSG